MNFAKIPSLEISEFQFKDKNQYLLRTLTLNNNNNYIKKKIGITGMIST
jgi:hypothetical protein